MDNDKKAPNIIIGLVIIAALVFGIVYYSFRSVPKKPTVQKPVNKLENVKTTALPKGMPSDLPLESGAKILNNFNATAPNGQVQGTRTYLSAKAMQTNYDIYRTYLTSHKWTIVTEVKDPQHPDIVSVFARNTKGTISVSVQKNNVTATGSTVSVTFVSAK